MEKNIKRFIQEFLVHLGIDFTDIELESLSDNKIRINVVSDQPSLLIGHHGENLIAMQKLIKVVIHKNYGENVDVAFDVDNYRKRQEENVLTITKQKIEEVRATGIQAALPPMSPYFRRIVHLFVRESGYKDLETQSMGQGNYRQVIIKMKN